MLVGGAMLIQQQCTPIQIERTPQAISRPNNAIVELGHKRIVEKWGENQWDSFNKLIEAESNWNWQATNKTSGAFGLGQALPASKMGELGKTPEGQLEWTIGYVEDRYATPNEAWAFWLSKSPHWY